MAYWLMTWSFAPINKNVFILILMEWFDPPSIYDLYICYRKKKIMMPVQALPNFKIVYKPPSLVTFD